MAEMIEEIAAIQARLLDRRDFLVEPGKVGYQRDLPVAPGAREMAARNRAQLGVEHRALDVAIEAAVGGRDDKRVLVRLQREGGCRVDQASHRNKAVLGLFGMEAGT